MDSPLFPLVVIGLAVAAAVILAIALSRRTMPGGATRTGRLTKSTGSADGQMTGISGFGSGDPGHRGNDGSPFDGGGWGGHGGGGGESSG